MPSSPSLLPPPSPLLPSLPPLPLLSTVPPGPPTGLQVTGQTVASLTISWTNPTFDGFSPIASFRVQVIAEGNVVGFSRDFTGDASTTSRTLGALSPFTRFTLRLFVINEVELEGESAETTGMTDSLRKSLFLGFHKNGSCLVVAQSIHVLECVETNIIQ